MQLSLSDQADIRIGIRVCGEAIKNICSAGLLHDMGYELQLLRVPRVVAKAEMSL